MKAVAGLKNEIWCMDIPYVDKLAKDNKGVKNVPLRQDVFDWTVDAKGMKIKVYKEAIRAYLTMITENNWHWKTSVDKGRQIAEEFLKLFKAEWIQTYSTMSETKAAFAEPTIWSLRNILYRYMEDYGYKYIHKLSQFVTHLNSRKDCSIDMIP